MIPAQAVQMGQNTAVVSVVGRDMTVASRTVQLGNQSGGNWIVLSGLKPGERVIIAGWQKVQPGQPVRVKGDARATTKPQGGR
jgi:membrane fusion protein (multidrug efflux system)